MHSIHKACGWCQSSLTIQVCKNQSLHINYAHLKGNCKFSKKCSLCDSMLISSNLHRCLWHDYKVYRISAKHALFLAWLETERQQTQTKHRNLHLGITLNFNDNFFPKSPILLLTELMVMNVCQYISFCRKCKNLSKRIVWYILFSIWNSHVIAAIELATQIAVKLQS